MNMSLQFFAASTHRTRRTALGILFALILLPASLPVAVGAPGDMEQDLLEWGGTSRTYWTRLPTDWRLDGAPYPLVLVLHGASSTGPATAKAFPIDSLADRDRAIVVYPNGVKKKWNDGQPGPNTDDVGFLLTLIDEMVRTRRADPARVYLIGFSNGGGMASRLLCERADRFTAVAMAIGSLAQTLYEHCRPSRPVSVMMINGTADPIVPYAGGAVKLFGVQVDAHMTPVETAIKLWARNIGAAPEAFAITRLPATTPDDGMPVTRWHVKGLKGQQVILYRVENAGHTWPDGPQYLPKWMIGPVKRGLDSRKIMWDFLMAERR